MINPDKKMFKYGIPLLIIDVTENKCYVVNEAIERNLIKFSHNEDKVFVVFDKTKCEIIAITFLSNYIKLNEDSLLKSIKQYNESIWNILSIEITKEIAAFAFKIWYSKDLQQGEEKYYSSEYLEVIENRIEKPDNWFTSKPSTNSFISKINERKKEKELINENKELKILEDKKVLKKSNSNSFFLNIKNYLKKIKLDLAKLIVLKDFYMQFENEVDLKLKEQKLNYIISEFFQSKEFNKFYKLNENQILINEEFKQLIKEYLWLNLQSVENFIKIMIK